VFIGGAPPNDKIFTKNPKYLEQYRYIIKQERKSKKPPAVSGSVLIIYAFGAHGKSFPQKITMQNRISARFAASRPKVGKLHKEKSYFLCSFFFIF